MLAISTIVVFFVQWVMDLDTEGAFSLTFGLSRTGIRMGRIWQLATYVFLHGGLFHLLINMLVLYMFGREMEQVLGQWRLVWLYAGCGVVGGLGWLLLSGSAPALCIGASGAVFGITGAFAALFPDRRITLLVLFVLPVTMTARTMAIVFGLATVAFLVIGEGNIAHAAHLAGGVAGYAYGLRLLRQGFTEQSGPFGWRRSAGTPTSSRTIEAWFREEDMPDRDEIDRILEKVSSEGLASLSGREKKMLDRASREGMRNG